MHVHGWVIEGICRVRALTDMEIRFSRVYFMQILRSALILPRDRVKVELSTQRNFNEVSEVFAQVQSGYWLNMKILGF